MIDQLKDHFDYMMCNSCKKIVIANEIGICRSCQSALGSGLLTNDQWAEILSQEDA